MGMFRRPPPQPQQRVFLVVTAGPSVSANAELASGTGAAANITNTLQPNAGNSAGTGAAYVAAASEKPNAAAAAGTGAALNATVEADVSASAQNAAGTGASASTSSTIQVNIIIGQLYDSGETYDGDLPYGGVLTGIGVAANAGKSILAPIQAGAGTGAAANATATQAVNAAAELASGTGAAAFLISAALNLGAAPAAGTSDAFAPIAGADSGAVAEIAVGTGAALNAAVSIAPNTIAALSAELPFETVIDDFTRSVSSGLGTADSLQAWTVTGTATDYAVDGSAATFTHTTVTQARRAWLSSVVAANVDLRLNFKGPVATVLSYHDLFIQTRQTAADGDYRMARIRLTDNGDATIISLALMRRAVGVETVLATAPAFVAPFEAATYYTIRVRLLGQGMFAKLWKASDSEPTDWQVSAQDTQLVAPGGVGMRSYSPAGTYPMVFSWDALAVDQIIGVSTAHDATVAIPPSVTATPTAALGTGEVRDNVGTIAMFGGNAAGTGSVSTPSFTTSATIEIAEGTGAANDIINASFVYSGLAAGTGATSNSSASLSFSAASAEGGADAFGVAFGLNMSPALAAGTGAVNNSVGTISLPALTASGLGAALNAGFGLTAPAGLAAGIGAALNPSTHVDQWSGYILPTPSGSALSARPYGSGSASARPYGYVIAARPEGS